MTQILLPIVLFMVPVMVVVLLATVFGRRLSGSCGGKDGSCVCRGQGSADEPSPARSGSCRM